MQNIPVVTRVLLIANVAVFLLQQMTGDWLILQFALWPLGDTHWLPLGNGDEVRVGFHFWQLLSYGFLHGSFAHIAFNMLALWMFGGPVEGALGGRRYGIYYVVCVIGAACAQLAVIYFFKAQDFYPTLGASGGIFGLLLAFAIIFPSARVALMFIPIPIPAPIAVVGYMVIELVLGVTGTQEGVAHFAHLGGALAGFVLLQYWRAQTVRRRD